MEAGFPPAEGVGHEDNWLLPRGLACFLCVADLLRDVPATEMGFSRNLIIHVNVVRLLKHHLQATLITDASSPHHQGLQLLLLT